MMPLPLLTYLRMVVNLSAKQAENMFFEYADLTQEGVDKETAFKRVFGADIYDRFKDDGYLSQYYNGPDRDYDLD